MLKPSKKRISEEHLAEYWYAFMHALLIELNRAYRKRHAEDQLEQKDIASRLGRSPGFISRCLSGQQNMTVRSLNNIARAMDYRLNVSLVDLADMPPTNRRPERPDDDVQSDEPSVSGSPTPRLLRHTLEAVDA